MPYKYRDVDIPTIPKVDRPREKLQQYGVQRLSNSELLALIIRTGKKGENAVILSEKILTKFHGLFMDGISYESLCAIPGLGAAKASQIIACFELGKRLLVQQTPNSFFSPEDVWRALYDIRDNKKEHVVVFYLDTRSQQIARETISIGTVDKSLAHPREIFEPAVRLSAAYILVAHNHPSGDVSPSDTDILLTNRLVEAGNIMGIDIIDHVIVSKQHYLSFKERGLL